MKKFIVFIIFYLLLTVFNYAQNLLPLNPVLPLEVTDITVDNNGNILAAVSGSKNTLNSFTHGAVFITGNLETWSIFGDDFDGFAVTSLAVNQGGDVFAGTDSGGVYRTIDTGSTWNQIITGLTSLRIIGLNSDIPGYLFACSKDSGIFRSTDNGDSWTAVNNGLSSKVIQTFLADSEEDIFCGTGMDPVTSNLGIFKSTNYGNDWTQVFGGDRVYSLTINPVIEIYFGAANSAVIFSNDKGNSWDYKPGASAFKTIAADVQGNLYGGTSGGGGAVYSSTDNGNSWQYDSTGFIGDVRVIKEITVTASTDKSINKSQAGTQIVVGHSEGFEVRKQEYVWERQVRGMDLSDCRLIAFRKAQNSQELNELLVGGDFGILALFAYNGFWFPLSGGINSISNADILEVNPQTGKIFASGKPIFGNSKALYRWDDQLSQPDVISGLPNYELAGIAFTDDPNDLIVALKNGQVFLSPNNGDSFNEMTGNLPTDNNRWIQYCNNTIFVAKESGELYSSSDDGKTYNLISNGLPTGFIANDMYCNDNLIIVVGSMGIYISENGQPFVLDNSSDSPSNIVDIEVLPTSDRPKYSKLGKIDLDSKNIADMTVVDEDGHVFEYTAEGWVEKRYYHASIDLNLTDERRKANKSWSSHLVFLKFFALTKLYIKTKITYIQTPQRLPHLL